MKPSPLEQLGVLIWAYITLAAARDGEYMAALQAFCWYVGMLALMRGAYREAP